MYEVDDAVAKIDGYIISVQGAGPFVGQKRLVRIESAGRTAATAVLIDLSDAERERVDREKAEAAKPKRRSTRGGRTTKKKDPEPATDSASQEEEDAKVKASTGPAGKTESDGGEEAPRRGRARARRKDDEPAEAEEAAEAPGEDEDALESKPRRRGRRGGRRRSRAKADEAGAGEATEASE